MSRKGGPLLQGDISEYAALSLKLGMAFLDAAARQLRLGIMPAHLLRWVEEGSIPLFTAWQYVPQEVRAKPVGGEGRRRSRRPGTTTYCHRLLLPAAVVSPRPCVGVLRGEADDQAAHAGLADGQAHLRTRPLAGE